MRLNFRIFKRIMSRWRPSPYVSVISLTLGSGLIAQSGKTFENGKKEGKTAEAHLNKNVYSQHEYTWRGDHGKDKNDTHYLSISPELATSAHDETNNVVWIITNSGNDLKKPTRVVNYRLQAICEALKKKGFEPMLLSAQDVEIMISNNELGAKGTRENRIEQTQIKASRFGKEKTRVNDKRATSYPNAKKDFSKEGIATVDVTSSMKLPRFVLVRTGSSSEFREYSLFQFLESLGVPVINSSVSIAYASNKMLAYILLAENQVPIPNTFCLDFEKHVANSKSTKSNKVCADDILVKHNMKLPLVMKLQNSSCGRGVFLARDKEELEQLLRICEYLQPNSEVVLQEYMKESFGTDVRIWVVGEKVVGAVRRVNENVKEFRSNVSVGGKATEVQLDEEMKELAVRAAHVLGLDFAGIDLLLDHKDPNTGKCQWRVGEVNSSPGWDETAEELGLEMPNAIVEHVCSRYNIHIKPKSTQKPQNQTDANANANANTSNTNTKTNTNINVNSDNSTTKTKTASKPAAGHK